MSPWPLLSTLVFTPWVGALVVFALRNRLSDGLVRGFTLGLSLSTLALGACALGHFDPSVTGMQLTEKHAWISALNVNYHFGLDGLSLVLVLLTGIVSPVALYGTLRAVRCPAVYGALGAANLHYSGRCRMGACDTQILPCDAQILRRYCHGRS